jgi:hypothetical protein
MGTGPLAKLALAAGPGDFVVINYIAYLRDGTIFDNTVKRGKPVAFQVALLPPAPRPPPPAPRPPPPAPRPPPPAPFCALGWPVALRGDAHMMCAGALADRQEAGGSGTGKGHHRYERRRAAPALPEIRMGLRRGWGVPGDRGGRGHLVPGPAEHRPRVRRYSGQRRACPQQLKPPPTIEASLCLLDVCGYLPADACV